MAHTTKAAENKWGQLGCVYNDIESSTIEEMVLFSYRKSKHHKDNIVDTMDAQYMLDMKKNGNEDAIINKVRNPILCVNIFFIVYHDVKRIRG